MGMIKYFLFLLAVCQVFNLNAQHCDCKAGFDSVRVYLERNYAGFADKITAQKKAAYVRNNAVFAKRAGGISSNLDCVDLIDEWLAQFSDNHLHVQYQLRPGGKSDTAISVRKDLVQVTPQETNRLASIVDINKPEGIYYTADSTYRVAVIKNKRGLREFAAIILSSKAPTWVPGEVKFELRRVQGSLPANLAAAATETRAVTDKAKSSRAAADIYRVTWHDRQHNPSFDYIEFSPDKGLKAKGWLKESPGQQYTPVADASLLAGAPRSTGVRGLPGGSGVTDALNLFPEEKTHLAFFKQIDSLTGYLRIQTFGAEHRVLIDSVVKSNEALLTSLPRLIIDIRYNGGGADISYRPLKRLMYTAPVKTVGVDIIATSENLDNYARLIKGASLPPADEKEYLDLISKARESHSRKYNIFPDQLDTMQEVLARPSRIGIIINGFVGSTAEQFLFEAKQSGKVRLYGSHTRGVLDYANVCDQEFACLPLVLYYPITRSRRVDLGQGIDNIGLRPDVAVDLDNSNWLQLVMSDLGR